MSTNVKAISTTIIQGIPKRVGFWYVCVQSCLSILKHRIISQTTYQCHGCVLRWSEASWVLLLSSPFALLHHSMNAQINFHGTSTTKVSWSLVYKQIQTDAYNRIECSPWSCTRQQSYIKPLKPKIIKPWNRPAWRRKARSESMVSTNLWICSWKPFCTCRTQFVT